MGMGVGGLTLLLTVEHKQSCLWAMALVVLDLVRPIGEGWLCLFPDRD